MRIAHRISLRLNSSQRVELEALGVKVPAGMIMPGGGDPLVSMDIDEDHKNWTSISGLFQRWSAVDVVSTKFTKKEIADAKWLVLLTDWHYGYPQPDEGSFGFRDATYDLSEYCLKCGTGLRQKAHFQMKGEPKWGRNNILQMNWVFDEFFVMPNIWETVFKPYGIGCRPVTDTKGAELKTVVQLVVNDLVSVAEVGLQKACCDCCNRVKYFSITRGPFPRIVGDTSVHMVKTKEYFGSGASAHKGVLMSQALFQAFVDAKVVGAGVAPVNSKAND